MITNFPCFYRGWGFFQEFLIYPGGLVEYLSAFLSQFLYYSWAGAFVLTLQGWLIFICTVYFFKRINAPRLHWLCFIPPTILLVTYNQYLYPFVAITGLLTALVFACLYLKISLKKASLSLFVFSALSVILYTVAGVVYLFFAMVCAIYEVFFRCRRRLGLLYLVSAMIIPYVLGVLLFSLSINNAFGDLLQLCRGTLYSGNPKATIAMVGIVYLLVPLVSVVLGLCRTFFGSGATLSERAGKGGHDLIRARKKSGRKQGAGILSLYRDSAILRWFVESLVLFSIAGAVVFSRHNSELKGFFAIDYYAFHRMWPEVLGCAPRYLDLHFATHSVDRALYHTGRLGYDMFCYPQHPGILLLPIKGDASISWKRFDTYLDLGLVNRAEHDLVESLSGLGEHPMILKRLALINMVKGRLVGARIYLSALSKTLFDSVWANSYLERLAHDPNLSTDEPIQHIRRLMLKEDYHFTFLNNDEILSDLLRNNRQNRMAFEYLMTRYLLTGCLEKFAQNLERLDDFNYLRIPRLYEEAILYMFAQGQAVDLSGRQVSGESRERHAGFIDVYNRHGRNKEAALNELWENYRDSYFFYRLYVFPGVKR